MQELAILLSSIAGAGTAVAINKFPRRNNITTLSSSSSSPSLYNSTKIDTTASSTPKLQSLGASSHIKKQITYLMIEKDILNKTIARLYDNGTPGLSVTQREKLLLQYQHQLGIILAKLEKLEIAKQHPDLGPVGDGLITLMDQKLSQLDNRLYELSSKITVVNSQQQQQQQQQQTEQQQQQQTEQQQQQQTEQQQQQQQTEQQQITKTIQELDDATTTPSIKDTSSVTTTNPITAMQKIFNLDKKSATATTEPTTTSQKIIPTVKMPKAKKIPIEITTLTSLSKNITKNSPDNKSSTLSQKIKSIITKPRSTATSSTSTSANTTPQATTVTPPTPQQQDIDTRPTAAATTTTEPTTNKIPDSTDTIKSPTELPTTLPRPPATPTTEDITTANADDTEEDLEKLKSDILNTLSKLEQAEDE